MADKGTGSEDEYTIYNESVCLRVQGFKPHQLLHRPGEAPVTMALEQFFGCKIKFSGQVSAYAD